MPPGRPRGASTARNANSGRQQPTLSFNSKPTRVTKATGPDPLIRDKKKSSDLAEGRLIAEPEELEEKTITQNVREKKELEQSGKQDIVTGPNSGPNSGSDLETEVTVSANSSRSTSGASLAQESPTGEVKSLPTSSKPQSRPPPKRDELAIQAEKITDAQIKRYWKKEEDARKAPRVHQQSLPTSEKILRHFDLSSQYGPCIGIDRKKRWRRAHSLGLNPPIEVLALLLRREDGSTTTMAPGGQKAYVDELMA